MQKKIYDVLGIGFGPSNLALAVAIDEQCIDTEFSALFLEQKEKFNWHPDMLLPGAEMQISFLKDLATLRNPSSRHTFPNYLKTANRLSAFANLRSFYPTRVEFNDYLSWVAKNLDHYACYGRRVVKVSPCGLEPFSLFEVTAEDLSTGKTELFFAKNIVVAPGGTPTIPFPLEIQNDSQRVWHSSKYLAKIESLKKNIERSYHFAVIGRGQSAAEIVSNLHSTFPNAKVSCIYRGFGLKPADESEFVNEIFDSSFVDFIHSVPRAAQERLLADHADTNYSVVDSDLIRNLYKTHYDERVSGRQRLSFENLTTVTRIRENNASVEIEAIDATSANSKYWNVDAVVLATGYSYPNPPKVLEGLKPFLRIDEQTGDASVSRHYRLQTASQLEAGIYVQGCNEKTHGLSDTLLSVLSIRSDEILKDLLHSKEASDSAVRHNDADTSRSAIAYAS